jgi:Asp-tRNA(Asn)/Glu-tRNA(Gln) amidotransferase A subunit family amidase
MGLQPRGTPCRVGTWTMIFVPHCPTPRQLQESASSRLASRGSVAAGYPNLTVPAGFSGELPVGLSFIARAWEEPKLLRFGYAFEQAVKARHAPKFIEGYGVRTFIER